MIHIQVYPNPDAVAEAAAQLLYERLHKHAEQRRFALALSGGSTPRLMYRHLRTKPDIGELLSDRTAIFFSDERAVPPESEQSNYHTAAIELFEPLHVSGTAIYRMRGEAEDLRGEASRYEELVRVIVGQGGDTDPVFDLILLGMGPDGHTASLFPGPDIAEAEGKLVAAPYVASLASYRLTYTFRLINLARTVLFLVTGEEKAEAVKKVLSWETQADILPAGRVDAEEVLWMIDTSAAQLLRSHRLRGTLRTC